MQLRVLRVLSPLTMIFAVSLNASAVDLTFDFTSGIGVNGPSTFAKTVSGYTLTFANPTPRGSFQGDGDGLVIGFINTGDYVNQFTIQLTGGNPGDSLLFKNYEVGWIRPDNAATPFDLTDGTGTSTGNSLSSLGIFNFNGSFSITQGQTVTFLAPALSPSNGSQIKFMTLTVVPVPEPSTYALSAIAVAMLAYQARRRRSARG